jgi:short-subunit dehydrogenase
MNINTKTFVVTGAASGIGRAITMALLKQGAEVAAVDLKKENLELLKKDCAEWADKLSLHELNITDKKGVAKLPDEVIKMHGQVDGLINNAGIIQPFVKVNDLDYEAIERVMNVNFYGMLYMTKAFLPVLLKRSIAHIVNVSSMGGFLPVPGQTIYGASKAAVKLFTEGLGAELTSTNVGVTVVFPGATATNITKNSGVKSPISEEAAKSSKIPTQSADDVAALVVKAIVKNQPRVFAGKDSKAMDRIYRISPSYATGLVAKQMSELLKDK